MTLRRLFSLSVLFAGLATAVQAAPSTPKTTRPHSAAKVSSASSRRSAAAPVKAPATGAHEPAAARTLDDIHIAGEIPVPQVLFITARDQRRFMEFQHRRYLKSGRQLGEASQLPDRIVVTPSRPTPEKETSR
jgi:hypothetical protein